MGTVVNINPSDENKIPQNTEIAEIAEALVLDVRNSAVPSDKTISMPIAQLSTLGAGVSSLIPAFNSVTQTTVNDELFNLKMPLIGNYSVA